MAVCAAVSLNAPVVFASKRGSFERTLSFFNLHTGETLKRTYWADGRYDPQTLREINHLLRDYRTGEVATIDRDLLNLLHQLGQTLRTSEPFQVISGYRSPTTNELLRKTGGGGVAKKSYHMKGMAIDVALDSRSVKDLRRAALGLRSGGVGYYPKSGFVHVDVGKVRSW
ncbi:MAG: DUF882 domain-containing protein [Rhodospirillum sp.]|nr:DUF882 domain-containing protein [Rhodospirillum sp.]MCF8489808.1 DUF882 domain-containing protein [Rhodospirillum sp.]MCF8501613.1 DUF882 domain-containing protein [Rhodospirillum sp.]